MDASQLLDLQKRESLASGSSEDMAEEPVQSVPILAHSAAKTISDLGGEMNPMRRKQVDGQHVSKLQGIAELLLFSCIIIILSVESNQSAVTSSFGSCQPSVYHSR